MTTAADANTAWSAITTVQADIIPQATSSTNAAKASQLQGAQTALAVALAYVQDVQKLVVGF
jgi:hypothetical protein